MIFLFGLEATLQPHRCRTLDSRCLLVDMQVRDVVFICVVVERVALRGAHMHEGEECGALNFCLCITHFTGPPNLDRGDSADVDVFNMTGKRYHTQKTIFLSVARSSLAATSLPNLGLAIFAGGFVGTC